MSGTNLTHQTVSCMGAFHSSQSQRSVDQALKGDLQELENEVEIPRSVPGLVTRRVLVMNYLQGEQITRLKRRVEGMSPRMRKIAQTRLLHRIADAYGMMIIKSGLFQADAHPGNLLVMEGTSPWSLSNPHPPPQSGGPGLST
jgi:predicted unusual protein kinase regulating ubiquinone biosynthesis (AarF/ABC1/UbiB family)